MTKSVKTKKGLAGLIVAMAALLLPAWAPAAEPQFAAGFGVEFASGKYGTGVRSESYYMPFTVAIYPTRQFDFSLEIPYVYQSGNAVNTGIFRGPQGQTMPMPTSTLTGAMAGTGSGMGSGMGSGSMTSATPGGLDNSQSGLGDITAKAGYILISTGEFRPQIRPNIFVKLPTADKDKALGTGEMDEGFALEISKWVGDWYSFAEAGYTIQGSSPLLALKNYLYYRAGVGLQVTDKFFPMFMLKGLTASAEGASDFMEVRLRLKYQATAHTGIEGYLAKGLTTNSPDYGTGLAIYYDF